MTKINTYKDLIVWQRSHQIAMEVFKLYRNTKKDKAVYEIWNQLIRSIFSVPGNIVEGCYSHFGANFSSKLNVAKGEAAESDYWLYVLSETGDITKSKYDELSTQLLEVIKMISSLRTKLAKN